MRTRKIYYLNNFPIYHRSVRDSHYVVLYAPSIYLSYNWKFVLSDHFSPISPPPTLCLW